MKDTTIVLIVIVVALIFIAPSVMTAVGQWFEGIGEWIKHGFGDGTFGAADAGISPELVIHFEDGSTKDFQSLSILPMTIQYEGGTITSVDVSCIGTLTYQGQIESYYAKTTWVVSVNRNPKGTPLYIDPGEGGGTADYIGTITQGSQSSSGSAWQSKERKTLKTFTVTAANIESLLAGKIEGTYYIWFETILDLTVNFADGSQDKAEAYGVASLAVELTGSGKIESLSVTFKRS